MKPQLIFALSLALTTGLLAQEPVRENEITETTDKATTVPSTIDFQGRLHDSGGSPVNATLSITFSLYDLLAGGTALWTETKSVQIADGLFQVKLGEVTPLGASHFSGTDRWLGIKVGTEAEMSPRTKISSTGYAMQAFETDPTWNGNVDQNGDIGRIGRVGIGVTTPTQTLDVNGVIRMRNHLFDYNNTSGTTGQVLTRISNGVVWAAPTGLSLPYESTISTSGNAFKITNIGTGHAISGEGKIAIYGMSLVDEGKGILGISTGGSVGVEGQGAGSGAIGIKGFATSATETNYGVMGITSSVIGYSGHFSGGNFYVGSNVGIGTPTPTALLHTQGTSTGQGNVVFVGEFKSSSPGAPPISGAGTRMMWYPDKAAFRAGYVDGNQWDQGNVGPGSFAGGLYTAALGDYSIAMGNNTLASGAASTALGANTSASGNYSSAMGLAANASGVASTALGYIANASGRASTAMGYNTNASAYAVTALGRYNVGGGDASLWVETDPLFEIGNGATTAARNNALTVLKNGRVGIGTHLPECLLHVKPASAGDVFKITQHTTGDYLFRFRESTTTGSGIFYIYDSAGAEKIQLYTQGNSFFNGGNLGIGTSAPLYTLDVIGNIRATGSVYYGGTASTNGTAYTKPDYVFRDDYTTWDIEEIAHFLETNNHLPWVTSAEQEKEENGEAVDMTRMAFETLESVENLQLQLIAQDKLIKALKAENEQLNARLERLERALESLVEK